MSGKGFRSPEVILMVVAGVAVAILGPYALYRVFPHAPTVVTKENQSGPPGVDLDSSELQTLPGALRDGAEVLLMAETPQAPDAIVNLPLATGDNVLRPVSEAVEESQPVLYWSAGFGEPPYTVAVSDDHGQVVARSQGIQNTSWMVPVPLRRGADYTWQVSVTGVTEQASFRVLDDREVNVWKATQAAHKDSHLVIGVVAQQLGMLGIAEREYTALAKEYPESNTAALLLNNVTQLRDQ